MFFNYWNNGGKKKFCDKILVRSVRAEPIDETSKMIELKIKKLKSNSYYVYI